MLADILRGGSPAFSSVKDLSIPPVQFVPSLCSVSVPKPRWKKEGLSSMICGEDISNLDPDLPVGFREQVSIVSVQDHTVQLSCPVVCKADRPLVLVQREHTAVNDRSRSWLLMPGVNSELPMTLVITGQERCKRLKCCQSWMLFRLHS